MLSRAILLDECDCRAVREQVPRQLASGVRRIARVCPLSGWRRAWRSASFCLRWTSIRRAERRAPGDVRDGRSTPSSMPRLAESHDLLRRMPTEDRVSDFSRLHRPAHAPRARLGRHDPLAGRRAAARRGRAENDCTRDVEMQVCQV